MLAAGSEDHATTVRNSLSRNVAVDMAARAGYLATRALLPPFILAHITLEAYGLWATAFILVSYIGISTMGLSNVYIKYIAEFAAQREFGKANRLLSTGLFLTTPICLMVFLVLLKFWPSCAAWLQIAPALRADAREVVLSVAAIFLASMSLSAFRDTLVAVQQTAAVQMVWIGSYSVETALIFLLIEQGRGIRALAEAFLVRTGLEVVCCILLAYRSLPWLRVSPALISSASLRPLLVFGGTIQIQSVLAVALNSVERVVAAPLIGLAATGLLDLAKKIPAMAASIPLAFASSLLPAASYLQGGVSSAETVQKLYLKSSRYMHLLSALLFAILAVMPGPILKVWLGKEYPGAPLLMSAFAISAEFNLLTGAGSSILRGMGRPKEEFYYSLPNLVLLALTLPLARVFAGAWTPRGIGVAVSLSTCLAAVLFLAHVNRLLGVSFVPYLRSVIAPGAPFYLTAAVLAIPVYATVPHLSRASGAAVLLVAGTLYALSSVAIVVLLVFDEGERLWFKAILLLKLERFSPFRKEASSSETLSHHSPEPQRP